MTDRERIAAHEAGHACACVMLGVPVRLVDVAGDATALGRVCHELEQIRNRQDARKRMIIILCGPIGSADDWSEVPSWPLNPNASTRVQPSRLRRVPRSRRAGLQAHRPRGPRAHDHAGVPPAARRRYRHAPRVPADRATHDRPPRTGGARGQGGAVEQGRMTFKARVRPIPSIEAIDPRLAEEIRAINAVFDSPKKALDAERKSVQCKSIPPTTVEEFPC